MALTKYTPGPVSSDQLNNANELILHNQIVTKIDQLVDRSVTRANDGISPVVEAFTSAGGRLSLVDTANTTAIFSTNKYVNLSWDVAGTIQNLSNFTNTANAFDFDFDTYSESTSSSNEESLGKTFSSQYVASVRLKAFSSTTGGGAGGIIRAFRLETYNGSTWDNVYTNNDPNDSQNGSYDVDTTIAINDTIQGVRVIVRASNGTRTKRVFELNWSIVNSSSSEVVLNIPANSFITTPNSVFVTAKLVDWESGASLQYKAYNGSEDTGWSDMNISGTVAYGKINTFTAFANEATKCAIKLIPKSSSPTAGYPSIQGVGVILN